MGYNKEYYSRYREEHKEQIARKNRLWRLNNPEKERAKRKRQKDSGYSDAYQKYYRTTAMARYSAIKSRARARDIKFDIPKEIFLQWFDNHPKYCSYCNGDLSIGTNMEHKIWLTIDRKDNAKHYTMDNIVISCMRCNLMKSNDISYELMVKIGILLEADRHNW